MLDHKDLKKFIDLPPEFNRDIIGDIETALDEYDFCRACIRVKLEKYGDDAFKNPDAYDFVKRCILSDYSSETFINTAKLLTTLEQMKTEFCGGVLNERHTT